MSSAIGGGPSRPGPGGGGGQHHPDGGAQQSAVTHAAAANTNTNPDPDTSLLHGQPMPGPHKYLGGALSLDGRYLFGVPSNAERVLRLDLKTGAITYHGARRRGKFKWLRGVLDKESGDIFCIPACADCVLRISPGKTGSNSGGQPGDDGEEGDDEVTITELGRDVIPPSQEWKWHGGALGLDGCIYGMPANAPRVLKIDPRTNTVSLIGPELHLGVKNKWYGGIRAEDGAIWAMPYNAPSVLKIIPATGEVKEIGEFGNLGGWKWHGGSRSGRYIVGVPSHAPRVLLIDTETDGVELIGPDLGDGRYKCGGAATDDDGIVWGIPSDIDCVLRIDPVRGEVTKFGPKLSSWKNKWQGAAVRGTDVYCIPCDAMRVLVVHTATGRLSLLPGPVLPLKQQKFQGAALADDGTIWGLPENCDGVLRIPPGFGEEEEEGDNVPAGEEEWEAWRRTWEESRSIRSRSGAKAGAGTPLDGDDGRSSSWLSPWRRWVGRVWSSFFDRFRELIRRSTSLTKQIATQE